MEFYERTEPVLPRPKPMKVLFLSFPRTGTTSTCAALKILGFRSYHFAEVLSNDANDHVQLWMKALRAKYEGVGKPVSREDFDEILWNYDSVSDEPCCLFVEELIAAYPEAKIVLTIRDRDQWLTSMRKSILTILSWRSWTLLGYLDGFSLRYWTLLNYTTSVISKGTPAYKPEADPALLESFDEHIEKVRRLTPEGRLLEWHASHGWKPLCAFLDVEVPDLDFPHLNEPKSLVELRRDMYRSRVTVIGTKVAAAVALLLFGLRYTGHVSTNGLWS
ncbi:unnamed protein product [Fusarium graminearum]|uniref:NAD dependent epimerase/dehydratase n=1 Tax=Fusarium austroamericanum TaxID=282268 RepID=A0AAN6BX79_FUSAU|nr:hypothetical protein FAUST_8411 [Fusarium austroamericanum]CZS79673.1 unnamed protein product [Fusarium graminearum]